MCRLASHEILRDLVVNLTTRSLGRDVCFSLLWEVSELLCILLE